MHETNGAPIPALDLDDPASYDYILPRELIARHPAVERTASRLMVCDGDRTVVTFDQLPNYLNAGDLLVFNDTKVLPCRLFGARPSGGKVELFVLDSRLDEQRRFSAITRANKTLKPGTEITLGPGTVVQLVARSERGVWTVAWRGEGDLALWLEQHGAMPLPPYILKRRRDCQEPEHTDADRERYQTVYAQRLGAVAAPTAGLHFTQQLLDKLAARGVRQAFVTLHVGMGTFKPLAERPLSAQELHEETYEVTADLLTALDDCRQRGGRVIAVGTTATRALEDMGQRQIEAPGRFTTKIFIKPGYRWHNIDGLITNFHLPKSSLIVMIAAFIGHRAIMDAYAEAVSAKLRFYSYGDAMFLTTGRRAADGK